MFLVCYAADPVKWDLPVDLTVVFLLSNQLSSCLTCYLLLGVVAIIMIIGYSVTEIGKNKYYISCCYY